MTRTARTVHWVDVAAFAANLLFLLYAVLLLGGAIPYDAYNTRSIWIRTTEAYITAAPFAQLGGLWYILRLPLMKALRVADKPKITRIVIGYVCQLLISALAWLVIGVSLAFDRVFGLPGIP